MGGLAQGFQNRRYDDSALYDSVGISDFGWRWGKWGNGRPLHFLFFIRLVQLSLSDVEALIPEAWISGDGIDVG